MMTKNKTAETAATSYLRGGVNEFIRTFSNPKEYEDTFGSIAVAGHHYYVEQGSFKENHVLGFVRRTKRKGLLELLLIGHDGWAVEKTVGNAIRASGLLAHYNDQFVSNSKKPDGVFVMVKGVSENQFKDVFKDSEDAKTLLERWFLNAFRSEFPGDRKVEFQVDLLPNFWNDRNSDDWTHQERYEESIEDEGLLNEMRICLSNCVTLNKEKDTLRLVDIVDIVKELQRPNLMSEKQFSQIASTLSNQIRRKALDLVKNASGPMTCTDVWELMKGMISINREAFRKQFNQLIEVDLLKHATGMGAEKNSKPLIFNRALYNQYAANVIRGGAIPQASGQESTPN